MFKGGDPSDRVDLIWVESHWASLSTRRIQAFEFGSRWEWECEGCSFVPRTQLLLLLLLLISGFSRVCSAERRTKKIELSLALQLSVIPQLKRNLARIINANKWFYSKTYFFLVTIQIGFRLTESERVWAKILSKRILNKQVSRSCSWTSICESWWVSLWNGSTPNDQNLQVIIYIHDYSFQFVLNSHHGSRSRSASWVDDTR